jgi:hypothetical protein
LGDPPVLLLYVDDRNVSIAPTVRELRLRRLNRELNWPRVSEKRRLSLPCVRCLDESRGLDSIHLPAGELSEVRIEHVQAGDEVTPTGSTPIITAPMNRPSPVSSEDRGGHA